MDMQTNQQLYVFHSGSINLCIKYANYLVTLCNKFHNSTFTYGKTLMFSHQVAAEKSDGHQGDPIYQRFIEVP